MSDPSDPYLGEILHAGNVCRCMSDLVNHFRIHAVEDSREQGLAGFPPDFHNDKGDQQANERISQRKTDPYADRPDENGQTCQSICIIKTSSRKAYARF